MGCGIEQKVLKKEKYEQLVSIYKVFNILSYHRNAD